MIRSDIQTLTARTSDLGRSVDKWNAGMVWALVFAAIAAVAVVVTTRMVVVRSGQLEKAQSLLGEAKDRQLNADLKQKDGEIASANESARTAIEGAANLEVEALKLRRELMLQGPRVNLLVGEKRRALVTALRAFESQSIDVRRSSSVIEVNGTVAMSTPIGDDTMTLADGLIGILRDAKWSLPSSPLLSDFQGHGIIVGVSQGASSETKAAAQALVRALRGVPLETDGPSVVDDNRAKRVGTVLTLPTFTSNTIVLEVMAQR